MTHKALKGIIKYRLNYGSKAGCKGAGKRAAAKAGRRLDKAIVRDGRDS